MSQASEIILIAAVAQNRVIGRDNQLLWHIPADMAHFKQLTAGQTVIMGRKTWESLPPRFRPLPGRRNIVITRQAAYPAEGAEVANSLEIALKMASTAKTVFIIGGEQIYRQALPLATQLEITEVALSPEGDAWFPEILPQDWQEISRINCTNEAGSPGCAFVTWQRQQAPNQANTVQPA